MEKEKNGSSNIFFIIIIILLVIIIGILWYQLSQVKSSNTQTINQLQTNLSSKETQISKLENTINTISNVLDTTNSSTNSNKTNTINYTEITDELNGIDVLYVTNAIANNNNTYTLQGVIYTQYTISEDELEEIKKSGTIKLDGNIYTAKNNGNEIDLFDSSNNIIFKIKEKSSNEYYLERQAQLSDVWKLTNEYRQITISSDTTCTGLYNDQVTTVGKTFKNFEQTTPLEITYPDVSKTYSFTFENGKCTEVNNILTSIE